jgi:hypothetical protein
MTVALEPSKLRAWWFHRQGLDGSYGKADAQAVLQRSGWARSVGGVGPYLTLFSRAGIGRTEADRAAGALEIYELPSARGCTYVVPASDFALALKVGETFARAPLRVAESLGVTAKEVEKLCDAVVKALAKGVLSPDEIREATGNASRSLGEAGKKKGVTTTLPLALGELQSRGEIRRVPVEGRLDQQRYKYTLWRQNPLANFKRSLDEAFTELARRFFKWIGPATLAEFQAFSGLGVKASKAAVESLGLIALADRLAFADDAEAFAAFKPPRNPEYVLTSSLDGIYAHRGYDLGALMESADSKHKVWGKAGPSELPSHMILDRGRLIGLWEYDIDSQSIAWMTFAGLKDKNLETAVRRIEAYVRGEVGDARSFSLDSPKSRAARIGAIRG